MFIYLSLIVYRLFEFEYYVGETLKSFLNLFVLEFKINIFLKKIGGPTGMGTGKKFPTVGIEDGGYLRGGDGEWENTLRPYPVDIPSY